MDFGVVTRTGITKTELAWLCGVSRVTTYNWLKGGAVHYLLDKKVGKILAALAAAEASGALPLPANSEHAATKTGRVRVSLENVVRAHLK